MQETEQESQSKSKFEKFVQQAASVMMHEPEHLQEIITQLRGLYMPVNVQEEFWLSQIALCQLRTERLDHLECGIFSQFLEQAADEGFNDLKLFPQEIHQNSDLDQRQRHSFALAVGFRRVSAQSGMLLIFYRAQSQAERHLRRAQEQFDRIRKCRLTPPAPPPPAPPPPTSRRTQANIPEFEGWTPPSPTVPYFYLRSSPTLNCL